MNKTEMIEEKMNEIKNALNAPAVDVREALSGRWLSRVEWLLMMLEAIKTKTAEAVIRQRVALEKQEEAWAEVERLKEELEGESEETEDALREVDRLKNEIVILRDRVIRRFYDMRIDLLTVSRLEALSRLDAKLLDECNGIIDELEIEEVEQKVNDEE